MFGEPEQMAELLGGLLPGPLHAAIDWASIERLDGTFVDVGLATRHADLLFAARRGSGPVLIHLVVEHKSGSDRRTALQLLRYRVRIWDRWLADHPGARSLPPILPVVIHHGGAPWTAPRSVRALVECGTLPDAVATFVLSLQADAPFLLDDLAAATEDDLSNRSLSVVADLTLRFLRFVRKRSAAEAADDIARWQGALRNLLSHPRGQDVMAALFSWFLAGVPRSDEALRAVLIRIHDPTTRQTMKSIADDLHERGFALGLEHGVRHGHQQGHQQGHQAGRLEGRVQALRQLLAARFGELPPDVVTRVQAGDEAQLVRWTGLAATAPSLAAVFGLD